MAFDPFAADFAADPYRQYAALRAADPVHLDALGTWYLFRFEDVRDFLKEPSLSVDLTRAHETAMSEMLAEGLGERADDNPATFNNVMFFHDPPKHTRLRRLVTKAFSASVVKNLEPRIRVLVDDLLDDIEETGECDIVSAFTFPLPFQVITHLLGADTRRSDEVREWSGILVQHLDPTVPGDMSDMVRAATEMRAHAADVIEWKRQNPADDLLTRLIEAREEDDRLNEDELIEQVVFLYIAGHETTVNLLGNGIRAMLADGAAYASLVSDPTLAANAVEEVLRYDPPVQFSRRITVDDMVVRGTPVEAGATVMLSLGSAGRDQEYWGSDAETIDLRRDNARENVAFGAGGRHHCIGAALARLEGVVAFEAMARRFPDLRITGDPVWNGRVNLRGLDSLPVSTG